MNDMTDDGYIHPDPVTADLAERFPDLVNTHRSLLALREREGQWNESSAYSACSFAMERIGATVAAKLFHMLTEAGFEADASVEGQTIPFAGGYMTVARTERGMPSLLVHADGNTEAPEFRIEFDERSSESDGTTTTKFNIVACPEDDPLYAYAGPAVWATVSHKAKEAGIAIESSHATLWPHSWTEFVGFSRLVGQEWPPHAGSFDTGDKRFGGVLSHFDIVSNLIDPLLEADGGFAGTVADTTLVRFFAASVAADAGRLVAGTNELAAEFKRRYGPDAAATLAKGDDTVFVIEAGGTTYLVVHYLEGLGDHTSCAIWLDPATSTFNAQALRYDGIKSFIDAIPTGGLRPTLTVTPATGSVAFLPEVFSTDIYAKAVSTLKWATFDLKNGRTEPTDFGDALKELDERYEDRPGTRSPVL